VIVDDRLNSVSRPRAIGWSFIAMLVVTALSVLVGFLGSEHGFGWELAAVFGTALGTTLLAVATGVLGLLTWRDVSAAQELARLTREEAQATARSIEAAEQQAETARAALDAQTAPFFTVGDVNPAVLTANSAQIRNVGNGTGIVTQALFVGADGGRFTASIPDPAVPPQETTAIRGWNPEEGMEWLTSDNFSIVALYADVSGRERGAVRLDVYREPEPEPPEPPTIYDDSGQRRWKVTQVHWAASVEKVIAAPTVSSQRLVAE
jgi:hypothetical protein